MSDSDGGGADAAGHRTARSADVEPTMARAMVGVRGMDSEEARRRVHEALAGVHGVHAVGIGDGGKMVVDYDASEATVMDLIRSLRRIGFLAGME